MNFMIRYGITIILMSIVWAVFILSPEIEIGIVALVVSSVLIKEKISEIKGEN